MQPNHGGIIILDGPDGAGKTTLAEVISQRAALRGYTPRYEHLSKPIDAWAEHRDALLNYVDYAFNSPVKNCLVIADRHFMSEAIYGHVYRQGSEYPLAMRHVDRLLYRYGALRVVCAPPVEYVTATHERLKSERAEMYDSGMETIGRMYWDLWNGCDVSAVDLSPMGDYIQQLIWDGGVADKLGWYHYDVTSDGNNMVAYADHLLDELQELTILTSPFLDGSKKNLTGWPRRQAVLLVGDRISDDSGCGVPFMANHGSSLYLARTLQKIHADESRVCIVNVNDPDGIARVRDATRFCGRTIALGRAAEQGLEKAGLSYHARVRHPQHARRFTHHDNSYAQELRAAFNGMAGVY